MKGLVTMNTHVQYESPITSDLKVMAKVKVFQKWVKLQGQGYKVKQSCQKDNIARRRQPYVNSNNK